MSIRVVAVTERASLVMALTMMVPDWDVDAIAASGDVIEAGDVDAVIVEAASTLGGLTTALELREAGVTAPIVVVGDVTIDDLDDVPDVASSAVLNRPFTISDLRDRIVELVGPAAMPEPPEPIEPRGRKQRRWRRGGGDRIVEPATPTPAASAEEDLEPEPLPEPVTTEDVAPVDEPAAAEESAAVEEPIAVEESAGVDEPVALEEHGPSAAEPEDEPTGPGDQESAADAVPFVNWPPVDASDVEQPQEPAAAPEPSEHEPSEQLEPTQPAEPSAQHEPSDQFEPTQTAEAEDPLELEEPESVASTDSTSNDPLDRGTTADEDLPTATPRFTVDFPIDLDRIDPYLLYTDSGEAAHDTRSAPYPAAEAVAAPPAEPVDAADLPAVVLPEDPSETHVTSLLAELVNAFDPVTVGIWRPDGERWSASASLGLRRAESRLQVASDQPLFAALAENLHGVLLSPADLARGYLAGVPGTWTEDVMAVGIGDRKTCDAIVVVGGDSFTDKDVRRLVALTSSGDGAPRRGRLAGLLRR
jgi:hypothetical protein